MTNPKTDNPELNLATLFAEYSDEDKARGLLESLRWPDGAKCPHCSADRPYSITARPDSKCKSRAGLYKCRTCRKQFTFKVGSIFEDSKIPCSKWCMAIALLCSSKKAVSSHQIHRMLGVTQKTAWFMSHRIRHAFAPVLAGKLKGQIEVDETFMGGKQQGVGQGSRKGKVPVVVLLERGGEVRTKVVDRISHRNLGSFLRDNIASGSTLNTDGNLSRQTDGLVAQIGALIHIADEQKNLAKGLENQTNKIIYLTWGLLIFSAALLAVSLITIKIMVKEDAKANIPQVQSSNTQANFSTNK